VSYDAAKSRLQLEQILGQASKETQELAAAIASAVARRSGETTPTAVILAQAFDALGVEASLRKTVGDAVVRSVAAGYGVLPSIKTDVDPATRDKALSLQWDPKGMVLSQQIHGTTEGYRQALDDVLRKKIAEGRTAQQVGRAIYDGYQPGGAKTGPFAQLTVTPTAGELPQVIQRGIDAAGSLVPGQKLTLEAQKRRILALQERRAGIESYAAGLKDGPLKAAYLQLAKTLTNAGTKGLKNAIYVATQEKARYYADRIARTETARAWGDAFRSKMGEDERVIGIRSRTSSAHKIFDICDFHAKADLFDMGPGVYPKNQLPAYPYHPHCLCLLTPVYRQRPSQTAPTGGPDVKRGAKALQAMTGAQRQALLTIAGHNRFVSDPLSWPQTMRQWGKAPLVQPKAAQQIFEALPKKWEPAKSVAEAQKWAIDNDLADKVKFDTLNLETCNEINRVFSEHFNEFKFLRKGMQFLGSIQERNKMIFENLIQLGYPEKTARSWAGKTNGQTMAHAQKPSASDARTTKGTPGIHFNEKYFGRNKEDFFKKASERNAKAKWLTTSGVKGIIAHELGHSIDFELGLKSDPVVLGLWAEAKKTGVKEAISGYAEKGGIVEAIAEGWAEAFSNESPRPFAKGLKERILQLMKARNQP
jgi:hypothetical protein